MKSGKAGSLESNDVLITVKESDKLSIRLTSVVYDFFHERIEQVIRDTLAEKGIDGIEVVCDDRGALDCTIRARLLTAVGRMEKGK